MLAKKCNQRLGRYRRTFLGLGLDADFCGPTCVGWILEQPFQFSGRSVRTVASASDDACDTKATHALGVVGLIDAAGHDQHGSAGAQSLARRANATLVDDGRCSRK